jgi:biotin operon repressor
LSAVTPPVTRHDFGTRKINLSHGAPEEIRTPDPQIRKGCSRIAGHRLGRKVAIPREGVKIWREAAVRRSLEMPRVYCRDAELFIPNAERRAAGEKRNSQQSSTGIFFKGSCRPRWSQRRQSQKIVAGAVLPHHSGLSHADSLELSSWHCGDLSEGRAPVWADKGHRTVAGHKLVRSVNARLKTYGRARRKKLVERAIAELRDSDPAYKRWTSDTLRVAYYRATPLPAPLPTEEDRWISLQDRWTSLLIQWGKETKRHPTIISAQQAREIVNRLVAVSPPHRRRAELDQLFVHMERRIHWNGGQKIKWLQLAIARLAANPLDWPIPISRRGRPDVIAGRIETYLANTPGKRAHKRDIVAALRIPSTTAQTTLSSLERARRIVRVAQGVYQLPTKGVSAYVTAEKAILDALGKGGQRNCAELRAETGKSEGAVHAALHRLRNAGSIVLTKRGGYALAGSAPPHVYARDAISDALRSGKKTMPELIAATGKNYGEIWAALRRLEAKGRVKQVAPREQLVAFALSNQRRRRAQTSQPRSGGQADRRCSA